jgi:hypothetical protein
MEANMIKKYIVELTSEERTSLRKIINAKWMAAHKRHHAQMLLKVDQGKRGPGWTDAKVAEAFDCTQRTVERLRIRLTERGFEAALEHGNRGSYRARALDGVGEAHLIALACGDPPKGRKRWTVRLLADQMVALKKVDACSKSAVHRVLKKTRFNLT